MLMSMQTFARMVGNRKSANGLSVDNTAILRLCSMVAPFQMSRNPEALGSISMVKCNASGAIAADTGMHMALHVRRLMS